MILYPIETCPEDSGNKNTTETRNETKKIHLNLMFHFLSIIIFEKGNQDLSLHDRNKQTKKHNFAFFSLEPRKHPSPSISHNEQGPFFSLSSFLYQCALLSLQTASINLALKSWQHLFKMFLTERHIFGGTKQRKGWKPGAASG